MSTKRDAPRTTVCVMGVGLVALGVLVLTVPGGIDIVDGETRYEVARSLVDDGDSVIRNEQVWFGVFPGRAGDKYTTYRFPHSVLGAAAIIVADTTGERSEARRQFFFVLTSAACGAICAIIYFLWFLNQGASHQCAGTWALAGVFCTPLWYYSTTTFDDIFGSVCVIGALVVARPTGRAGSWMSCVVAGLLIGLAFNCKQPLAVFVLAAVAAVDRPWFSASVRSRRAGLVVAGLIGGIAVYVVYDAWKFPPEAKALHAPLLAKYMAVWPGHPWLAIIAMAASPATGVLWYFPPLPLCMAGLANRVRGHSPFAMATCLSIVAFVAFIVSISFFKGDPAWGPRYLTPVFAVLWLFARPVSGSVNRRAIGLLLLAGCVVQLLAISVDPQRLYIERRLPTMFGAAYPALYFDARNAHLVQRPREIAEIWFARRESGETFSPGAGATFSFPVIRLSHAGTEAIEKFKLLNSFRPWWASYDYVPPRARAISRFEGISVALAIIVLGIGLIGVGPLIRSKAAAESRNRAHGDADV